jgi:hypothetical protein
VSNGLLEAGGCLQVVVGSVLVGWLVVVVVVVAGFEVVGLLPCLGGGCGPFCGPSCGPLA